MDPQSVWPLTRGEGVTVAVIDSGVSASHDLLAGQVVAGQDFVGTDNAGRCDGYYHGTAAAGIIAGKSGVQGVALHGIAPEAQILPVRIVQADEEIPPDIVADAITWAVDAGADVINMSLTTTYSPELQAAVTNAAANDVVLVAAGGNILTDEDGGENAQPIGLAAQPGVIAVSGVNPSGEQSEQSVAHEFISVAAPGADVWAPMPNGEYAAVTGTSFATPIVSGVAALVRAYHRDMPAEQVAAQIIATADRPYDYRNNQVGYGVVNPYRAVTAVLGARPNVPTDELALPPREVDPLATARQVAAWAALAGVVTAALLLLAPPAIRRGRQRRWRPARMDLT